MAVQLRMCVVCRSMKEKNELVRVAKNKNGEIGVDREYRLPGRGAYICRSGGCSEKFIRVRAFERAFHCTLSDEIKENIMKELI